MAVTGTLSFRLSTTETQTEDLSTALKDEASLSFSQALTDGTGANQVQQVYHKTRAINDTGEVLDLAGLLVNAFNETLTFTQLKAIGITAAAANTINVLIGPDATAGFLGPWVDASDRTTIEPGGAACWFAPSAAGWTVTGASLDEIFVAAATSGTVTYSIFLIGEGTVA